jgi:hypothetical protein
MSRTTRVSIGGIAVLPPLTVRHLQEHKKRQDAERLPLGNAWRTSPAGTRKP